MTTQTTLRRNDKTTLLLKSVLPFGQYGYYARDMQLARQMFESRELKKPRWAVRALVGLRAGGVCEVCGERTNEPVIRQFVPNGLGGIFAEPFVIGLCEKCSDVWSRTRNYVRSDDINETLLNLKYDILTKRAQEFRGAGRLTNKGDEERKKVKQLKELIEKETKK